MKLKRQIFISFCAISLMALSIALLSFVLINHQLSMKLYGDNLSNSTQIQANVIEEQINRFLVRNGKFAFSEPLRSYLSLPIDNRGSILSHPGVVEEIFRFTDEMLDSVSILAIVSPAGEILYSNGTSSDTAEMVELMETLEFGAKQTIAEVTWGDESSSLAIATPIVSKRENQLIGNVICIYSNDYFLKSISVYRQFGASNAFIFCSEHDNLIQTKHPIALLEGFKLINGEKFREDDNKAVIDGQKSILHVQKISGTPWVLVNSTSTSQVYSRTALSFFLSILTLSLSFLLVLVLSKRQSAKILLALEELLSKVEKFLISEEKTVPVFDFDKRTEIGYLADKFSTIAAEGSIAQKKLQETDYLYNAILHSAYFMRIYIDFENNEASSSNAKLGKYLEEFTDIDVKQRVMIFFRETCRPVSEPTLSEIEKIVFGELIEPREIEFCCRFDDNGRDYWFRVLSVPVVGSKGELGKVVLHFEDISEKKREEQILTESSQRDLHTGLLNKNTFLCMGQELLDKGIASCSVFFIDLDNFKPINDFIGHGEGDIVLMEIAHIIASNFRSSDLVARYGGDEFVALVPEMDANESELKAEALVKAIPLERTSIQKGTIRVSASIGVCVKQSPRNLLSLISEADVAMYVAKNNGRCQYYMSKGE